VFHKVIVSTNAAFKDHECGVIYMASNYVKIVVGKSIGVKVSLIVFAKVLILLSAIL